MRVVASARRADVFGNVDRPEISTLLSTLLDVLPFLAAGAKFYAKLKYAVTNRWKGLRVGLQSADSIWNHAASYVAPAMSRRIGQVADTGDPK
jgi:hypothetical protein